MSARTKRVVLRVELDVDLDTYHLEYGVRADQVPADVEAYVIELLSNAAAANSGAWTLSKIRMLAR